MADLIVIAYDDEFKAEEVRLALFRMQKEHLVDLEDAVVVTKTQDGKVRLNQSYNLVAAGAATGSLWGALIGLLFLNPLLGVAAGAAGGALAGPVLALIAYSGLAWVALVLVGLVVAAVLVVTFTGTEPAPVT